jgi:preprotein translocase subunit SecF
MDFLRLAKKLFFLSAILSVVSLVLLIVPGPRMSIEFTGGTRMELAASGTGVTAAGITTALQEFPGDPLNPTVNRIGNGNYVVRIRGIDNETHGRLVTHMNAKLGDVEEVSYTTIGPTVGETLKQRAVLALLVAGAAIILYLALAFRKVPRRYSPWKFGITAVVTMIHDLLITAGIFVVISRYTAFEIDTLFVTALLTVLGYSVNDRVVIFDRIRENLFVQERKDDFETIVRRSVGQIWKRSLFTGTSVLIMLFCLLFLGSETLRWFALTLVIGIVLGTYSSIFVATPLLVYWNSRSKHS